MCRPIKCQTCSKTTWAGCGQHVTAVKANVPRSEWCDGRHSQAQIAAAKSQTRGFFTRFFTR